MADSYGWLLCYVQSGAFLPSVGFQLAAARLSITPITLQRPFLNSEGRLLALHANWYLPRPHTSSNLYPFSRIMSKTTNPAKPIVVTVAQVNPVHTSSFESAPTLLRGSCLWKPSQDPQIYIKCGRCSRGERDLSVQYICFSRHCTLRLSFCWLIIFPFSRNITRQCLQQGCH